MNRYLNKYRIASARLQHWDYGSNAAYFITICTHNRECFFGKITDGILQLNDTGKLAEQYWMEIPNHFPFIELGAFVIMPNHVHGILVVDKRDDGGAGDDGTGVDGTGVDGTGDGVETPKLGVSTGETPTQLASQRWKPQTIGVIINQYKRVCTINARKINTCFAWQSRFYDHIIRDNISFERIKNYIMNNPANWKDDKFFGGE